MAKQRHEEGGTATLPEAPPTDADILTKAAPQQVTDADILARAVQRDVIRVNAGDFIVHVVGLKAPDGSTCWLKAQDGWGTNLTRMLNILGIALEGFTYVSGEGASIVKVRYVAKRQWIEPFRGPQIPDPETGRMLPGEWMQGGDMVVFDEAQVSKANPHGQPPEIKALMDPAPPTGAGIVTRSSDAISPYSRSH